MRSRSTTRPDFVVEADVERDRDGRHRERHARRGREHEQHPVVVAECATVPQPLFDAPHRSPRSRPAPTRPSDLDRRLGQTLRTATAPASPRPAPNRARRDPERPTRRVPRRAAAGIVVGQPDDSDDQQCGTRSGEHPRGDARRVRSRHAGVLASVLRSWRPGSTICAGSTGAPPYRPSASETVSAAW